ncbi:TonB-dependent receptor plug domain-containing protein [uncultured Desulfobacter sp.]|uniref:TonB-dependent receptor plug domain-containing protein n=1 Tax=uncultured Desulfobacter sp. TaxID=240139 RepID=UPI0029F567CD|nr:TonB-dependent receptor plug domain-containing protein [uncultured Desulfobacter sp.]
MLILIEKIIIPSFRIPAVLMLIGMICISVLQPCLATEASLPTEETALETITVTAQKREEDVQKVTTSITVLSDMAIEDAGIESTQDIWRYVPNLFTSHEGSRDYFYRVKIRGISNTGFGDPAVVLYIDDVSYAGDYNKQQVSGSINAPLIEDKLFFRVAGLYSAHDGYIKNVFNGRDIDNQETVAANAGLFFTPSDNLLIDLKFRVHEYDDDGGYPAVPMDRDKYQAVTGLTGLDDFEIGYDYSAESSSKTRSTSLRVKYEQDSFDPEVSTAFELGVKTQFPTLGLRVNAAFFIPG